MFRVKVKLLKAQKRSDKQAVVPPGVEESRKNRLFFYVLILYVWICLNFVCLKYDNVQSKIIYFYLFIYFFHLY